STRLADLGDHRAVAVGVHIDAAHARAFPRQSERDGSTNIGGRPGHQRGLAAEETERCWCRHETSLLFAEGVDADDLVLIAGITGLGLGSHELRPANRPFGPRWLGGLFRARL